MEGNLTTTEILECIYNDIFNSEELDREHALSIVQKYVDIRNEQIKKSSLVNVIKRIKNIMIDKGWTLLDEDTLKYKWNDVELEIDPSDMTVKTTLTHPSKGHTTLYRKNVSFTELKWISVNPRLHTNKGYQLVINRKDN